MDQKFIFFLSPSSSCCHALACFIIIFLNLF
nr:MAG TPA: hypothetical protein [Crassvirales sp.]